MALEEKNGDKEIFKQMFCLVNLSIDHSDYFLAYASVRYGQLCTGNDHALGQFDSG